MSDVGFIAVRSAGGLLPIDTLVAVVEGKGLDGLTPGDYHLLAGETLRGEANRAWQRLLGAWRAFRDAIDSLPQGDPAIGVTRDRWLLPLFNELGYGRLESTPPGGLLADGQPFAISHLWRATPIHLLGAGVDLDHRSGGVAGAAKAAPHAMVQELLNRSGDHLWAFLSNGRTLRVLRDNASLVRQAYLDFDLEAIFDGELFSEFVAVFLVCHQSRVEARDDTGPRSCWLETWRTASVTAGTRALEHLRDGVVQALRAFGSGFLRHPANAQLRAALTSGQLTPQDYYRALLRLAYRLLFVFVAEERNLLHHPNATAQQRDRYTRFFSTRRLRMLATRSRSADRHPDLWQSLQLVFDALGNPDGLPALGLPNLGGFLFDPATLGPLVGSQLTNADLLAALRPLALVRDPGGLTRTIDYRNLDSEELGSVYESLLQLVPRHDPGTGMFDLAEIAGNERKTTGSYYTPSSLIASLLDTALEPLLDDAVKSAANSDEAEAALLRITVCDPACGSGHFLVAAARRIAKRVAAVRTGDPEPAPAALRTALRDVVGRCIYGVDVNDLAAELAKVSLWLEALEPGKPLSFLDSKIKVGNSLLGTTPALLARGIPDDAFAPLTGDNKKHARDLKKRNKHEHESAAQGALFNADELHHGTAAITARWAEVEQYDDSSPSGLAARADAWRRLEASPELQHARFVADAWCAAFVATKKPDSGPAITDATFRQLGRTNSGELATVRAEVAGLANDYRFFHWHLEFPDVFATPDDLDDADNPDQGWTGGFTCILGNPPWERVKLQEQEFFAARDPDIATAPSASARRRMIADLTQHNPELMAEFEAAKRRAEGESHLLRNSGRYPLCGRGDINTYAVFAETDRLLLAPHGRTGVIVPTGIATDATTQHFFRAIVEHEQLVSFFDFDNKEGLFPSVGAIVRFSLLTMGEGAEAAQLAFLCRKASDVLDAGRRLSLTPRDILSLNPNTGTLTAFSSAYDAHLALSIYGRVPILSADSGPDSGWTVNYTGMFHMTNDSHLFHTLEAEQERGSVLQSGWLTRDQESLAPLYEPKFIQLYDHRFGSFEGVEVAQRFVKKAGTTSIEPTDPWAVVTPRYWVNADEVSRRWPEDCRRWAIALRGMTNSVTNARTAVVALSPYAAFGNGSPLLSLASHSAAEACCLVANLSAHVYDYCARQKITGGNLNLFILRQTPVMPVNTYSTTPAWDAGERLETWIGPRVLELVFTAWDMKAFAVDADDKGAPFRWDDQRRATLRAELDAAFFHLYGILREDVAYILDTFAISKRKDEAAFGEYRTKQLILEIYDAMAEATVTGSPYQTVLDPPPGHGQRHPER